MKRVLPMAGTILSVRAILLSRRLGLLGLLLLAFIVSGCSSLQRSAEAVDGWLVEARNLTPVTASYRVERQRHYPVATDARLRVLGDEALSEELASALASHFQDVAVQGEAVIGADQARPATMQSVGFYLQVDKSTREQRIIIKLTDGSSQRVFDRVRINFSNPDVLADGSERPELGRALKEAAAQIAGSV